MSAMGGFIFDIGSILGMIIQMYMWVVIIAALISWVRPDPYNPIVQILHRLTEPAYSYIRRFIPTNINGIDLAPMLLIVGLMVLQAVLNMVVRILASAI